MITHYPLARHPQWKTLAFVGKLKRKYKMETQDTRKVNDFDEIYCFRSVLRNQVRHNLLHKFVESRITTRSMEDG